MASMAGLGSNLPSNIANQLYSQVATVSYPTPRALNATAFQQSVANVAQQVQQNVPASSTKQRVFTGTVTKVHDNFGFVDEDVFFQTRFVADIKVVAPVQFGFDSIQSIATDSQKIIIIPFFHTIETEIIANRLRNIIEQSKM